MNTDPQVFIVDDDQSVRESLVALMNSAGIPCHPFDSAEAFLAAYDREDPGCLLLDERMPGMSGIDLLTELRDQHVRIPCIMISGHGDIAMAVNAMKLGAVDFIEKPFSQRILLDAVRSALARARRMSQRVMADADAEARIARLTPREMDVMRLVVSGDSSRQVALKLHVSKKTVDTHRAHIMKKLQTDSVAELVRLALRAKVLEPAV